MKNNCLLMGNELATFVEQIVNLKSVNSSAEFEKVLLENDNVSRTVNYVLFKDDYSGEEDSFDKLFYILDGSGIFAFGREHLRYISGDIVPAPSGVKWSFDSDKSGTKLIEVSSLQKSKSLSEEQFQRG